MERWYFASVDVSLSLKEHLLVLLIELEGKICKVTSNVTTLLYLELKSVKLKQVKVMSWLNYVNLYHFFSLLLKEHAFLLVKLLDKNCESDLKCYHNELSLTKFSKVRNMTVIKWLNTGILHKLMPACHYKNISLYYW